MEIGNTNSNLINSGRVVAKNNWVFFSNFGIYKMKEDGSAKEKLGDDSAFFMNVVGGYLYYDAYVNDGYKFIKMKIDGSEKKIIFDKRCMFANIVGDWVYFISTSEENPYSGHVCKIKTDGSAFKRLSNNANSFCLNVVNDWVYFLNRDPGENWDSDNLVYRIKTDGTDESKYSSIQCIQQQFVATDECVYQDGFDDDIKNCLFKINSNGKVIEKLNLTTSISSFCVLDGWVYYFGFNDNDDSDTAPLFKIKVDGTNNKKLLDVKYNNSKIFVAGDWIYYTVPEYIRIKGKNEEHMVLYRVRTNGTMNEKCLPELTQVKQDERIEAKVKKGFFSRLFSQK